MSRFTSAATNKKAAQNRTAFLNFENAQSSRFLRRSFFGLASCDSAFEIIRAAFAFDDFVILSSHNSLLCSRVAVLCCHYESLRAAIQSLFDGVGDICPFLRMSDE